MMDPSEWYLGQDQQQSLHGFDYPPFIALCFPPLQDPSLDRHFAIFANPNTFASLLYAQGPFQSFIS
jgi:hypothetical protein